MENGHGKKFVCEKTNEKSKNGSFVVWLSAIQINMNITFKHQELIWQAIEELIKKKKIFKIYHISRSVVTSAFINHRKLGTLISRKIDSR